MKEHAAVLSAPLDEAAAAVRQRNRTLLLCWVAMFASGFAHSAPLSMLVPIESSLELSAAQVSIWFNIQIFGMALLALPVGLLVDRYGPTTISYVGIVLEAIGGFTWGFVGGFRSLWWSTAILAVGGIFFSLSVPKLVALWMPNQHLGKGHGLYMSGRSIGSALGVGIIAMVFAQDWRGALRAAGLLLFASAVAWCWLIRRSSAELAAHANPGSGPAPLASLATVLRSRVTLLLAAILLVMMSANVTWLTFGYSYLRKSKTDVFTGLIVMTGIIGVSIGAALTPTLSDRFGRRRIFFALPALLLSMTFVGLGTLQIASVPLFFVVAALIGLAVGSIAPLIFVVATESPALGRRVMGVAVGVLLLVGNTPGLVMPAVGGWHLGTLRHATRAQYESMWQFLAGFVLLIPLLAWLLPETGRDARGEPKRETA